MSLIGSSNADYHANKTHLSSSGLKLLLQSPEQFYNDFVLGQRQEQEKAVFDEGSFTHTLILEPAKINEYAIFPGLRKQGAAWEYFKGDNAGKKILSAPQVARCESLARAYQSLPAALKLLEVGISEHTMVSSLLDVPVKARADRINIEAGYIVDIKTTSMPSDLECFKATIEQYRYELSAALYAAIASEVYKKEFDFYWLVLSKADNGCEIYKASQATLAAGAALYKRALMLYKKCMTNNSWTLDTPLKEFDKLNYEILEV